MMDRKAYEARKKLVDWNKMNDRGIKSYNEGRDWSSKDLREGERARGKFQPKKGDNRTLTFTASYKL